MNKTYEVPEIKVCATCETEKPVTEFNLHHGKTNGASKYRGQCKLCQAKSRNREKEKARGKIWREEHAEEIRQKKKAFLSIPENLEKNRNYAREYGRKRPEVQRKRTLAQYGLTPECYDRMLADQNNGCKICGEQKNGAKMNFVVDHDHITGEVRGLLCTQCNAGLGNFRDSSDLLNKAIEYLTCSRSPGE